jgi:enoyl-CoA hydratase/carnithine racemase
MTAYSTILYQGGGPIARIILNRPDKRNPIGPQTNGELIHALTAAREDPAVRVVILTGAGKAFSAGGDLSAMAGESQQDSPIKPASLVELLTTMHAIGKPIVAMVNGHALAGGMGLMLACDLVVASEAASFGTTEIKVGLWPMMITAEIIRNIGRKKALELMLTGERIDAKEAERIGLINRCVPAERLEAETNALAERLAAQSPVVMAIGLRAFYDTQDQSFREALEYLEGQLGRVLALEDAREGLMAFLQKRSPVWKGK